MNKYLVLIFSVLIYSCHTQKTVTEEISAIPNWVNSYPISESHYVGIGIADKSSHPQDYIQIAQQNALQNLMSQIKVTISSESVFLQMDRDYGYEEDFKSNIQVKANDILEGYELVSTYNQNNEYWVYYQLDKTLYAESRNARIEEAIEKSKFFLNKAVSFSTNLEDKFIYYVQALSVLEPYLSEPLRTEFDREDVFLGSEIIARFRSYIDDFQIYSLSKKLKAMLGSTIDNIELAVEYDGRRIANIPLLAVSKALELENYSTKTDQNGIFATSIPKIKSTEAIQKIEVGINFQDWLNQATQSDFIQQLFKSVKTHQIIVPVYVYTPTVFVESDEKHFGLKGNFSDLRFAAESALSAQGFTSIGSKNDAQLIMTITANTEKGRQLNGQKMYTSFLSLSVQVKDLNQKLVYSKSIQRLKGIQLDFEKSDLDAYRLASNKIKDEIIPDFIDGFSTQ